MYKGEGKLRKEEVTPFWSLSSANNSAVAVQVIHDDQPKNELTSRKYRAASD